MTLKKYLRNLFILLSLALVVVLSFEYYFRAWVPRYYLALSVIPSLMGLIQLTGMRAKAFEDRSIWDVLFIRNYPFMAAAISIGTLLVPQWMQNILARFWFNSWSTVFIVLVITWVAQRVAHDKLFAQEERNALQRITGQVKNLRKGQDALLQKIVNGVIMLNHQGKLVLINKAAQNVLGFEEDDVLGKSFDEVLNPQLDKRVKLEDEGDPLIAFKKKIIEAKEAFFIHQLDVMTKKDEAITLNLSVTPVFDDDAKEASRYILIFEDITQKYQLDKMRQDFVNIASHELRTPLTAINGYLSLLMTGQVTDPDEARLYMDRIFESTKRLGKLVKNILNVSRIDRKKMTVNFGPVDVQQVAAEEIENLTSLAAEKQIKLGLVNMLLRQTFARADEDMFREVVINFIENAIKYSNQNTEIKVALTRTDDNKIRIEVIDQGMGIEEKNIQKLFTQFYRVESSMVEEQQGTGLGLYITKKYVEAMEGEIGVKSKFGEGSSFYFDLKEEVVAQTNETVVAQTPSGVDIAQLVAPTTAATAQTQPGLTSSSEVTANAQIPSSDSNVAQQPTVASQQPASPTSPSLESVSETNDVAQQATVVPQTAIAGPISASVSPETAPQNISSGSASVAQTISPQAAQPVTFTQGQTGQAGDLTQTAAVDSMATQQTADLKQEIAPAASLVEQPAAPINVNSTQTQVAQTVEVPYTEPASSMQTVVQQPAQDHPSAVTVQPASEAPSSEASEGWKDWQQSGVQSVPGEQAAQP